MKRAAFVVLGLVGLASIGLGVYGTASAQEGGAVVVGLSAIGQSDGIGSTFGDPNTQPYPIAASQTAHTQATLSTGPTGYALASTYWPGPLVGNAGSLAILLAQAPAEAAALNYAGRAEAFAPAGPHDAELPSMRAHADGTVAEATAGAQDVEGQPGVATGDVRTLSRTAFENGVVQTTTSCTASDIDMADGVVHIGSVRTEANATSDGVAGTAAGRTIVSGVTVGGQEAVVDEEGVRFVDPVVAPVGEQILSQAGIEMFVAQPRTIQDGEAAGHHAGSLVILWDLGGSGYIYTYSICGSDADASLRTGDAFELPAVPTPPVVDASSPNVPPPARSSSPTTLAAPATTPTTAAPPAGDVVALDPEPAGFVRNLSIWPYILGAACCAAAGFGLRRARDGALAPRAASAACPLEGARP